MSGNTVRLICADQKRVFDLLCAKAGRNLSAADWNTYIGADEPGAPPARTGAILRHCRKATDPVLAGQGWTPRCGYGQFAPRMRGLK